MTHLDLVQRVRQEVRDTIAELSHESTQPLQETILVRDGLYCGRRFQAEQYEAIWFIEEGEIKFYAIDGGVLLVRRVREDERVEMRRAA